MAAQKGLESKGGIDPGTRPSFLSLLSASSSSFPFVVSPLFVSLLSPPSPLFNSCFRYFSAHLFFFSLDKVLGIFNSGETDRK